MKPDEIIPSLIHLEPSPRASSEVHVFYKIYRHLLQEIQKHQESMKQMAVQAAIGKVASHIAHDMRSPLSVIKSALETIESSDPDRNLLIKTSRRSTTKLDNMADDLLDYSKAHLVEKQPTNVDRIIRDVKSEVEEIAKHEGKTLKISIDGADHHMAFIDPHRMDRVLTNLMINAVHAIKHKNGRITAVIRTESNDLIIDIKDNGEGIPSEHLSHIFESTFTFGKKGGSGLGLSYCKNVVDAHGGTISAKSVPGKGSTFTVHIPGCITASATVVEEVKAVDPKKDGIVSNKRVLVMDDEEDMLICWRIKLKEATGRVPTEISAPEKLLESNIDGSNIDLAIIDYEFRGSDLNGLDVIEYLSQKGVKDLYLCTAYYQDRDIKERSEKLGIKKIIPKPIPENILQEIM